MIVDQPPRWTDPCQAVKDDRDRMRAILVTVTGALELALSDHLDADGRATCVRILAKAKKALT